MTPVTIVMAVYGQPLMLARQIQVIEGYSELLRSNLDIVIVDDCGSPPVDIERIQLLASHVKSVKLLRVEKDIPWNQPGARNLGMHLSQGWCLMIDPDMVFSGEAMARVIATVHRLKRGTVVKWALRHKNSGKLDMSSPNTWLIHRDDFFAIGGYDEAFAGNKGWSDVQLLDVLTSTYKIEKRSDIEAVFYSTADVPDAMVTSLDRSTSTNRKLRLKRVAQARAAGGWKAWAKKRRDEPRLNFPWKQIL